MAKVSANRIFFYHHEEDIKFYPYRTAQVTGPIEIELTGEEYHKLQSKICSLCQVQPDNHICFKVGNVGIEFSDGKVFVGELREGRY